MRSKFLLLLLFFLFCAWITPNSIALNIKSIDKFPTFIENSVLSEGEWYRLKVQEQGVYRITYNDLVQYGIDVASIIPGNIRIFGNGGGMLPEANWEPFNDDLIEVAIYISGDSDNSFDPEDYILFFGQSSTQWKYDTVSKHFNHIKNIYSDYSYYFLNIGSVPGKRIPSQASVSATPDYIVNTFNDFMVHENDSVNIIKSGKEWYGEYFNSTTSYSFPFTFQNINHSSDAWAKFNLAARNYEITIFNVSVCEKEDSLVIAAIPGTNAADYARYAEGEIIFTPDENEIVFSAEKMTESSTGWMNYVEVNVIRDLVFTSPQMIFRNTECVGTGHITEFDIANPGNFIRIWDITSPAEISEQQYNLSSNVASFNSYTDVLKEFIVFDSTDYLSPAFVEKVKNQNLHGMPAPDMIIITHPLFESQAERLAAIHEAIDNFNVAVVTPQQIYNEFSSGAPDITGIRNFMRMFYTRADSSENYPHYLLLFGDASYDYKDRIPDNTNLVPTYQSNNSLVPISSYLTDDYFGILDSTEGYYSNGNLDLGIGRIPAKSIEEAEGVVDKIESYLKYQSEITLTNGCNTYTTELSGDWRNIVSFIADDEDNNLHLEQAENLSLIFDTAFKEYNIEKIYLDAYPQLTGSNGMTYPDVTNLINERVKKGALIINYTGHGGETGWTHEKVIQVADIESWDNIYNMPAFVTATCEFSRFDEPSRTSAGELVLLNPNGGGIALFTTTRVAFAYSNFNLNKSFCKDAFTKDSLGNDPRLGDIIRKSKIDNGSIVNIRNFVLLGDPALRLAYPMNNIITTEINGHDANTEADTIKSHEKISVKGYIQDVSGQKMVNFNGTIYPTVFDKKTGHTTLGNDNLSTPRKYQTYDHIIFKGKTSVINGDFEFSFVVPEDIAADYAQAKISYYAKDSLTDANGFYENPDFIIGGIDNTAATDNEGPSIRLFFNDTTFINGGTTDENPVFLAHLVDSSGIQYTGYGIGHDIVAYLDGNTETEYVLNDYFLPATNSYQSGSIAFPFQLLEQGSHTISLKAWDIFNNSSEASLIFIVTKPGNLTFKNVFNFPNPFSENTCFYFEHNQPCCDLQVELEIYTINGILVKTIHENVTTTGQKYSTLCWNGRNDSGAKLKSGVYVYKLKVISGNDSWLDTTNRLVIF